MIKSLEKNFLLSNFKDNKFLFLAVVFFTFGYLFFSFSKKEESFIINDVVWNYGDFNYSLSDMKKGILLRNEIFEMDALIDGLLVFDLGNKNRTQNLNIVLSTPDTEEDLDPELFDHLKFNDKNFLKSLVVNDLPSEKFKKDLLDNNIDNDNVNIHRSIEFIGGDDDYYIRLLFTGSDKNELITYFNIFKFHLFKKLENEITNTYLYDLEKITLYNEELINSLLVKLGHHINYTDNPTIINTLNLYGTLLEELKLQNDALLKASEDILKDNFNLKLNFSNDIGSVSAARDNSVNTFLIIAIIFINFLSFAFFSTFNVKKLFRK